jgi:cyclophilin family peptidyl-prolyl cis-trans isomerase
VIDFLLAVVMAAAGPILSPAKTWYAPNQPIEVAVQADQPAQLVLTDFTGKPIQGGDAAATQPVDAGKAIDARSLFPQLTTPGTYLLYAVPPGRPVADFTGTPLVVQIRRDPRPGAPGGPIVVKVEPLRYAIVRTDKGDATIAFYFDVAPDTADSFLRLAKGGFFDGLTFHRVVPGFVVQGGDPKGDGTGGPGYPLPPEFSDRPHVRGTLSMARQGDPEEAPGVPPRYEFASSAGSQFFISLDHNKTRQLDGRYTVFAKVTDGMSAIDQIAAAPLADARTGKPAEPQVIRKVDVVDVTPGNNPYATLFGEGDAAGQ